MALPVFGNPRGKKRRHKRGGSSYHKFVKRFLRAHKGTGFKEAGAAWKCKRHGMKGKWKPTKRQRHAVHAHVAAFRRSHKMAKKRLKQKHSLQKQLSDLMMGGGGRRYWTTDSYGQKVHTKAGDRKEANIRAKLARVQKSREGRAFKAAARAEDKGLGYSFFGFNPSRRGHMGRRKHSFSMNPPSAAAGLTAGFRPSNLTGVLPIIAGAVANGVIRGLIGSRIPMVSKGIPAIAAGIATAGVVGLLGNMAGPAIGQGVFTGALVETLADAFVQIKDGKLGLSGMSQYDFDNAISNGVMSDFADPRQIGAAFNVQQPILPSMHHGPRRMADFAMPIQTRDAVESGPTGQYLNPLPGSVPVGSPLQPHMHNPAAATNQPMASYQDAMVSDMLEGMGDGEIDMSSM